MQFRLSVCLMLAVIGFAGVPLASAQESSELRAVRQAHDALFRWLGDNDNARAWKRYLMSDELTEQLARGRKADRRVVRDILNRYYGNAPGQSRPRFTAVRDALAAWHTELSTPTADELPQAAREAKSDFRPVPLNDLTRARALTQQALDALERFLSPTSAWRTHLRLADLRAELRKPQPSVEALSQIYEEFSRDYRGLEYRQFTAVRSALAAYVPKLRIAQDAQAEANFQQQLDVLADALTAYGSGRKAEHLAKAAAAVRWLEDRQLAPRITKVAREEYWKPNLFIDISPEVVTYGFRETVDESEPINEYRNEAQIVGTIRTVGRVEAKLKPFDRVALIHSEFRGTGYGRTTAYASRATVYSRGTTTIHAIKQISLDRSGFRDYPTTAAASTQSYTEGINSAYAAQASQQVEANRPANNERASRQAEDRIRRRMDRETTKRLAEANDDFYNQYIRPLTKYGAYPADLHFSTTADALRVRGMQSPGELLAATEEPPGPPPAKALATRVHETFLNNTAWAMYSARTVGEDEFRQELTDILGRTPERFKRKNDNPPWTITFAAGSPISVRFGENSLIVSMHGTSFKSGRGRPQDIPMNITASYTIARDTDGPKYVRQGKLQVLPPDIVARFDRDSDGWLNPDEDRALNTERPKLSNAQLSLRGNLESDFADLFEPELRPEPVELRGRWKPLGQLKADHLAITNGWLTMGYVIDRGSAKEKSNVTTTKR